jgi:vitamin B12/bleomycin/antimicrobial peptide transport system ATP-binding/permease protein
VIFLISIMLLQLLVYYRLNFWNRDFFNAVERKDEKDTEESKRTEAELRSIGADLRESGEATAFPDGKRDGRRIIGTALDQVIAKWLALCWQNMRMTLVSHTNFLLSPILALLPCMPKYVAGTMTLGDVIQAAAAFVLVQSAFNRITDSYVSIAEWTSSANRVASLLVAIDQIECPK